MDTPASNHQHTPDPRALDRSILAIAVPSLGALIAEPLFILIDSAIVGRLGTYELAGLGVASTVLTTLVGLCVFLAYATTAAVARHLGADRRTEALRAGIDGLWLAGGLGLLLTALLITTARPLLSALGANSEVLAQGVTYLTWSAPGLPGMLIVMAATGVLRGFQDARTPLWIASAGAILNAALSATLVWGVGMGIAGSGLGTAITQILMAVVLAGIVIRRALRESISIAPARAGILLSMRGGAPLLLRTLSLRIALLLTVFTATGLGAISLAGHQVVYSLWGFAAFGLDALAIAAQTLIGNRLGASDRDGARTVLRRTLGWGVWGGAVVGGLIVTAGFFAAPVFTADTQVQNAIAWAALIAGITMPITGWVCVLDGVLIGAGDGVYLAKVGVLNLAVYAPFAIAVHMWAPAGVWGLVWLWGAFAGVFMLVRAATTGWRIRDTQWMRVG